MALVPSSNTGGSGSGTVTSVSSADTSVAVATGTTTPVLTVAPLNTIAANSAASGDVAMNSHKLTGLAAGSASGNSVRYEQVLGGANALAVNNLVAGTAGQVLGGTGPSYALPPGFEIGYDQITTASISITSATESSGTTVISCGAHTFDGGAVMVELFLAVVQPAATDLVLPSLFESTVQITRFGDVSIGATGGEDVSFYARYRFTPSAGSHTYTVTAIKGTSNGTIISGPGGTAGYPPSFVRFTKV